MRGRTRGPHADVHDAQLDHAHEPREKIQAVRRHAVAARVGEEPRAKRRAIGFQADLPQHLEQDVVKLLIGYAHRS